MASSANGGVETLMIGAASIYSPNVVYDTEIAIDKRSV
jgi:hypothetical protein